MSFHGANVVRGLSFVGLLTVASAQTVAQNKDLAPLSIARQGYLFAGGKVLDRQRPPSDERAPVGRVPDSEPTDASVAHCHDPRGQPVGDQLHGHARRPRGLGPVLLATGLRGVRGGSARTRPRRLRSRRVRARLTA